MYQTSADVLVATRLNPMVTCICRHRHSITTTIKDRALLEERRGAKRRSGSLSHLLWWQQEMDLEEENDGADGGERGGVFPCLFYNEAGNEVDADQGQGLINLDSRKRFMNYPTAAPDDFNRGVNLDKWT